MPATPELSVALATLLRGPLHAEDSAPIWASITKLGTQLRDHLSILGMQLVVDDLERYAYVRTIDELPEGMPRLARRHALTFGCTVLLILLRKELTAADADGETPRVIVTTEKMTEWMRDYRRDGVSEDRINGDVNTLVKLGYLRKLRDSDDTFEARRIIKAIVTADWLATWRDQLLAPEPKPGHEPVTVDDDLAADSDADTGVDTDLAAAEA